MRASTPCSFHSTQTFRRALRASVHGQIRRDKECPFSGVTSPGRIWRKVPECEAWSVCCRKIAADMKSYFATGYHHRFLPYGETVFAAINEHCADERTFGPARDNDLHQSQLIPFRILSKQQLSKRCLTVSNGVISDRKPSHTYCT